MITMQNCEINSYGTISLHLDTSRTSPAQN